MNKRKHRGSDFHDFLAQEGILEEVEVKAIKRALSLQFQKALKQKSLTKTEMAERMKTSRAAVDRLLDGGNFSITLTTLQRAARALGQKLKVELVPA
jgi:predicted XRE-type DNA-binding protein